MIRRKGEGAHPGAIPGCRVCATPFRQHMRIGLSASWSAEDCQKIAVLRKIPGGQSKSLSANTGLTGQAGQNPFLVRVSPPDRAPFGQFSTLTCSLSPFEGLFPRPRPLPMPYNLLNEHGRFPDQDQHQRTPRNSCRERRESLCQWHGTGEILPEGRAPRRRGPPLRHLLELLSRHPRLTSPPLRPPRPTRLLPGIGAPRSMGHLPPTPLVSCSTISCAHSPAKPRAWIMPPISNDPFRLEGDTR